MSPLRHRACRALAAGAALALGAPAARAQAGPKAAPGDEPLPLLPRVERAGELELAERFQRAVAAGLARAGAGAVPIDAARQRLATAGLTDCDARACAALAAERLGTDRFVLTHVTVADRDYEMRLALIDGGGRVHAEMREFCDECTLQAALLGAELAAAELAHRGGTVERLRVPPGEPATAAEVSLTDIVPRATAAPAAAVAAGPPPATGPSILPVAGLAAVGVAALAAGAWLMALHGDSACPGDDPTCDRTWSTGGYGAVLAGGGAAAVLGAGIWLHRRGWQ